MIKQVSIMPRDDTTHLPLFIRVVEIGQLASIFFFIFSQEKVLNVMHSRGSERGQMREIKRTENTSIQRRTHVFFFFVRSVLYNREKMYVAGSPPVDPQRNKGGVACPEDNPRCKRPGCICGTTL